MTHLLTSHHRHTFSFSRLCTLFLFAALLLTACDNPYSPPDDDDTPNTGSGGSSTGGSTNHGVAIRFNITGVEAAN